jgi:1,2-diacylglycerol 3-beta-galactosyltransferase
MKKVTLVFFDAGGGHRSAVNALRTVIAGQRRPWQVETLNLQELLDPLDPFLRFTGIRLQDVYNRILTNGYTLGTAQMLRALHLLIRLYHPRIVRELNRYWTETRPDMVVSCIPNFNRMLAVSVRNTLPGAAFATIITDLADYPPHFWIERESQFLICGTKRAVEQARAIGHSAERIFSTSGMILNPQFYNPPTLDRAEHRQRLLLDPELPTGLMLFGGAGSKVMLDLVRRLDRSSLNLQLIAICGHNRRLADELNMRPTRIPLFVQAFTREVPYYMQLSDFFIGKTGPGSISEAVAMNLPVIVERNAWTMPQERYNADWILENGVGLVLPSFRQIVPAVEQLLEPATLAHYRARCTMLTNEAVFEIPGYFEQILARGEDGGQTSEVGGPSPIVATM